MTFLFVFGTSVGPRTHYQDVGEGERFQSRTSRPFWRYGPHGSVYKDLGSGTPVDVLKEYVCRLLRRPSDRGPTSDETSPVPSVGTPPSLLPSFGSTQPPSRSLYPDVHIFESLLFSLFHDPCAVSSQVVELKGHS